MQSNVPLDTDPKMKRLLLRKLSLPRIFTSHLSFSPAPRAKLFARPSQAKKLKITKKPSRPSGIYMTARILTTEKEWQDASSDSPVTTSWTSEDTLTEDGPVAQTAASTSRMATTKA